MDTYLSVTIPVSLLVALDRAASEDGRTRSNMLRFVLSKPIVIDEAALPEDWGEPAEHVGSFIPSHLMNRVDRTLEMLNKRNPDDIRWSRTDLVRYVLARHPAIEKYLESSDATGKDDME